MGQEQVFTVTDYRSFARAIHGIANVPDSDAAVIPACDVNVFAMVRCDRRGKDEVLVGFPSTHDFVP
jgi:hypothetical protein